MLPTRALLPMLFGLVAGAVACEQLSQGLGGGESGAADAGSSTDTPADAAASIVGGGCGTESGSGATLCVAISTCPDVVVDVDAMPGCGFRVKGSSADLVCACGSALCSMGAFATCAEARQLLENQTQPSVCVQLAEGRCTESATTSSSSSSSSSSSTSSSGGNPACDRQCVRDCGGGAACAAICNCD